ncbi:unnamed protein product [Rotaria socialis]|uniref:Uncharacterized protein n=1 Tax=Rotaria socialis TaxID=392032 RepID=A0A817SF98_9BILA|nr:unnamed protein product [Rotaria socialis]CAF3359084.1 unnamed protein product [Rotaria socialis]CAF3387170.1 unnamed protein product [Rotaria socialis]CAF3648792.1 unnamed protein product [Rotaria socialis]CAF4214907.1 unnamed protein product [Rotaria socialis]
MFSSTNIRSSDSFLSKSSSASPQIVHKQKQWIFRKIIELFLSFNIDRKETDDNTQQHAKLVLRAFFIYMIFVTNVLIVAFLSQSKHKFFITNAFEYHIIDAQFSVKSTWLERNVQSNPYKNARNKYGDAFMIDFNRIATIDDIWQFMNQTIGNVFYRSHIWQSNPNVASQRSIRWVLDHFLMIGVIRMRQVRVKAEKCNIPKSYSDEIADCYPAYLSNKKDVDPFGPIKFRDNNEINMKQAWQYMPANITGMDSHTGQYGTYDGSGYVADLAQYDRTNKRFTNDLKELEKFHWLDKATRAVFVDIITYNPSVNLFSYIKLIFEMPPTGGIFPSYKIENEQLFRYVNSSKYVLIGCEIIIVTFTIAFLFIEIVKVIELRWKIFLDIWNWIDIILLIILILMIIANIRRVLIINSTLHGRMSIYISTFDDLTIRLLRLQSLFDILCTLLTSISIIRILKYCDFAVTLVRIKATVQRCFGDLIGFLVMFVAIMIAYAQFGNLALGQQAQAFSTVGKAFVALFRTVLGDFDYEAISDASPIIGPLFFFFYIFSMVFILFNMVLAIIVDSYEELGHEHRDIINRMSIDVTPFLKHSIRKFFQWLRLWKKVKVIVQFIISAEDSFNSKTVANLLQELKYSSTSSLYDELRRAFAHDLTKLIPKEDFVAFLKYASDDKDRQRDALQSLFSGNIPLLNSNEQQEWSERARNLCTIQQWSQLRYRIARSEELFDLIEGKIDYIIRTSENLLQNVTSSLERSDNEQ